MVWNLNTVALLVPLLFLLVGLTITVVTDPYISRKHRRVMGVIIILSFILIAQNIWEDYIAAGEPQWFLRTTLAICGYTLRPLFLILFLYIVQPGKKYLGCWALAILNWGIYMTAYFSHWPSPVFMSALFCSGICWSNPFVITRPEESRKS